MTPQRLAEIRAMFARYGDLGFAEVYELFTEVDRLTAEVERLTPRYGRLCGMRNHADDCDCGGAGGDR